MLVGGSVGYGGSEEVGFCLGGWVGGVKGGSCVG